MIYIILDEYDPSNNSRDQDIENLSQDLDDEEEPESNFNDKLIEESDLEYSVAFPPYIKG
ncbi:hypothetical protein BDZ91DRAFT_804770 [Kalaharituber pfeilii]|nr:hypothetical protein BDZ91DRAFT_804770 [Kalaharituber pfeilii]